MGKEREGSERERNVSVVPPASEVKDARGQQFAPGTSPSPAATSCNGHPGVVNVGEGCEVSDRGTDGGRGGGACVYDRVVRFHANVCACVCVTFVL